MTVASVKGGGAMPGRGEAERRVPGSAERDAFAGLVKRRKRAQGEGGESDEQQAEPQGAGWPGAALMQASTQVRRGAQGLATEPGRTSRETSTAKADRDGLPSGAERVGTTANGTDLKIRFPAGPWAGLELQAAMHAGGIVLTLRPQTRKQEKRLSEARDALVDEVKAQTGADIRVELKEARDAAR
jgi:hypothetical protein